MPRGLCIRVHVYHLHGMVKIDITWKYTHSGREIVSSQRKSYWKRIYCVSKSQSRGHKNTAPSFQCKEKRRNWSKEITFIYFYDLSFISFAFYHASIFRSAPVYFLFICVWLSTFCDYESYGRFSSFIFDMKKKVAKQRAKPFKKLPHANWFPGKLCYSLIGLHKMPPYFWTVLIEEGKKCVLTRDDIWKALFLSFTPGENWLKSIAAFR